MTLECLMDTVLRSVRCQFYGDRMREFLRDRHALSRAVARYGYECEQRGWEFDAEFIASEFRILLLQIRETTADIAYLPIYLEGAVDRRIRLRADEISAEAKRLSSQVRRTVAGVRVSSAPVPSATSTLAALYQQIRTGRPKRTAPAAKQLGLF
jgi:hypothetical protein